ncbi:MAG: FHA domain-containing protein [Gammaproteobacteria bacterium]|nr:FHA domain-containing protein [Gammaproteobacteria bacterium]MDH3411363.1 FHA domain-containing protein [Gammaproteobacteria bacterium]
MAKLVLFIKGVIQREYPLTEGTIRIGRDNVNEIQLDDDTVSGSHAEVAIKQSQYIDSTSDYWLRDLGSTNGTKVNGQSVNRHLLHNEDEIFIGPYTLRFLDPSQQGHAGTTRISIEDDG